MKILGSIFTVLTLVLGFVSIVFLLSLLFALPVKWLWNGTMPELFGLKEINWWMAWKLSLLCAFLFKSFNYKSSKE